MSGTVTLADVGQVDDATAAATAAEAAQIDLGNARTNVDVAIDVSGAADVTIEASATGAFAGEERELETINYGSASTDFKQYHLAYQHVRVYASANVNTLEVVGRGV